LYQYLYVLKNQLLHKGQSLALQCKEQSYPMVFNHFTIVHAAIPTVSRNKSRFQHPKPTCPGNSHSWFVIHTKVNGLVLTVAIGVKQRNEADC